MYTKQQVLDSFESTQKLPKEEMTEQFKALIKKQEVTISFVFANVQQYKLLENTQNATIELLYYIFKLYERKNYNLVLEEKYIAEALKTMDVAAGNIEKEIGGLSKDDIEKLNKAVEAGESDKLTGKSKDILNAILNKKQEVSQPFLLDVISNYIGTDKLIIEKEKSFVFSIAETIIEAIEIQAKEHGIKA